MNPELLLASSDLPNRYQKITKVDHYLANRQYDKLNLYFYILNTENKITKLGRTIR